MCQTNECWNAQACKLQLKLKFNSHVMATSTGRVKCVHRRLRGYASDAITTIWMSSNAWSSDCKSFRFLQVDWTEAFFFIHLFVRHHQTKIASHFQMSFHLTIAIIIIYRHAFFVKKKSHECDCRFISFYFVSVATFDAIVMVICFLLLHSQIESSGKVQYQNKFGCCHNRDGAW